MRFIVTLQRWRVSVERDRTEHLPIEDVQFSVFHYERQMNATQACERYRMALEAIMLAPGSHAEEIAGRALQDSRHRLPRTF